MTGKVNAIYVDGELEKDQLAALKEAFPGADIRVNGKDAAVFALFPEELRGQLKDDFGLEENEAAALTDERLCRYLAGLGGSLLEEGYWENLSRDAGEGSFGKPL